MSESAKETVNESVEGTASGTTEKAGLMHPSTPTIPADEIPKVRAALIRYRVMAYTVGVLLILLMLVAVPLKYIGHDDRWVMYFGVPHGWLYMLLILTAIDLGRRVKWSILNVIGIALCGTVPFLSFVAEHFARKDVYRRIASSSPAVAE